MPLRGGDRPPQLSLVCLTRRARRRDVRGSVATLQERRHELRTPFGVRQAGLCDVLPHDARGHDDVYDPAKRACLPRPPAQRRAIISEPILERL